MTRFPRTFLFALLLAVGATAQAVGLSDTGQTLCYDTIGVTISCAGSGQDGQYGRDAANAAAALTKTGAGAAGFDFTKIANNGSTLAAEVALGTAATDWACTQDNVTGLTWEVKATSGLRSRAHTYSWYSDASNGGNAGSLGTDTCGGTLSGYSNQCNTANYVAAVNAATLCNHNDWRMPTLHELLTLVNAVESIPSIDATYFPHTQATLFWSGTSYVMTPADAWGVHFFEYGRTFGSPKRNDLYARLVRGGQF